jgi:hypothetical protein
MYWTTPDPNDPFCIQDSDLAIAISYGTYIPNNDKGHINGGSPDPELLFGLWEKPLI